MDGEFCTSQYSHLWSCIHSLCTHALRSLPPPTPPPQKQKTKKKTEITKQICWLLSTNLHTANMCKNVWVDERHFLPSEKYMMYVVFLCFLTIWHKPRQQIWMQAAAKWFARGTCVNVHFHRKAAAAACYCDLLIIIRNESVFSTKTCKWFRTAFVQTYSHMLIFDLYSCYSEISGPKVSTAHNSARKRRCSVMCYCLSTSIKQYPDFYLFVLITYQVYNSHDATQ